MQKTPYSTAYSATEPLFIGLFWGKWPIKRKNSVALFYCISCRGCGIQCDNGCSTTVHENFCKEVHAVEYADGCSRIVPKQFRKSTALALLYSIHLHVRECLSTILNCRGTINPLAQLSWPYKSSGAFLLHPFCTTLLHAEEYADGCSRIVPRQFRQSIALALFYWEIFSLQVIFRKRATNHRVLLRKVTHEYTACSRSSLSAKEPYNCARGFSELSWHNSTASVTILLHPFSIVLALWHTKLLHNLIRH